MANKDYRNYGTLEPEYYSDRLGPLTIKGKKQVLVAGLESKLDENQNKLNELKKYQESLKKIGKDLDKDDAERMTRIERIVSNLKQTINEQKTMIKLKMK